MEPNPSHDRVPHKGPGGDTERAAHENVNRTIADGQKLIRSTDKHVATKQVPHMSENGAIGTPKTVDPTAEALKAATRPPSVIKPIPKTVGPTTETLKAAHPAPGVTTSSSPQRSSDHGADQVGKGTGGVHGQHQGTKPTPFQDYKPQMYTPPHHDAEATGVHHAFGGYDHPMYQQGTHGDGALAKTHTEHDSVVSHNDLAVAKAAAVHGI